MANWLDVIRLRLGFRNLRGADLSHVDLRGLDLSGADLEGANLEGAIFGTVEDGAAEVEGERDGDLD